MPDIAFVTHRGLPGGLVDDRRVAALLQPHGLTVVPAVWDDPSVDWSGFAAVIIRSTWDYHHRPDEYRAWLRALGDAGVNLWNPAPAILANIHKGYLAAIETSGVPVVPTVHVEAGTGISLREVMERRGWREVVVKPAVSASAHGIWRSSLAAADGDQGTFEAQSRTADLLVQPYLEHVAHEGEWSLLFFHKRFSHAVLKRPADGDYRVQTDFGGSVEPAAPSAACIEQAARVLSAVASPLLYARVDGVDVGGRFTLMELEITEPELFLSIAPGAVQRFADAVRAVV